MTTNAYLTVDASTSLTVINIKSSKIVKQRNQSYGMYMQNNENLKMICL